METQIPQSSIRPNFPTQMPPQGHPPMMMGIRPGMPPMINPYTIMPDQEQKKKQFAKSVYVSGFEKTVTSAMLEKHFSQVRPVQGIKLPTSKFNENKGYAFVYYASEDDATLSKKQLDRSAILQEKIRVTKTVVAENLSKMIFKIKTAGLNDEQIQNIEKNYFNDENLEKEVEKIIFPLFGKSVEVNKIIIPVEKVNKKPLTYARVFFYISNLKEAVNTVRRSPEFTEPTELKNEYEIVLGYIVDLLNKDESFTKYSTAEIYEYTKKNQSNVLHLKGISYKEGESMTALADELKEFIQKQNMQWQVVNCYTAEVKGKGAWANITFATYDDTKKAYEHLKTVRPIFREKALYGSLRNVKDLRTVVFSVIRNDIDEKEVGKFLENLANLSPMVPVEGEQTPTRKYQYFSYNVIEQRSFYMDNEGNQIGKTTSENIPESWRLNNTVPRRLVVHFYNDIDQQDIKNLLNDIKVNPEHTKLFMIDDRKHPLRANHQKGHIKNNSYVKHTEVNRERKRRGQNRERPVRQPRQDQGQNRMPRQQLPNQPTIPKVDYNFYSKTNAFGGIPKVTPGMTPNMKPFGQPPMGKVPPMGAPMGMVNPPLMGGIPPMMGMKPTMAQPPMGKPPMMGGNIPPPMAQPPMGKPPMMGGNIPPLMGQKPLIPGIQPPKQP